MTGEITLRGSVLPIGGVKEKVLAAHRAELKRVVLPDRNRKDLVEVPDEIKQDLEFVFISRIDELLPAVLQDWGGGGGKTKKKSSGNGGTKRKRAPRRKPAVEAPPPA